MGSVMPASVLAAYIDEWCEFYVRAKGTSGSGYGLGTSAGSWGAAGSVQDMKTVLLSLDSNLDSVALMTSIIGNLENAVFGQQYARNALAPSIGAVSNHVQLYSLPSVIDIDSYMSYRNVDDSTKWQCLAPPQWLDINTIFVPSAKNVYFEVLQGATYTNALGKLVGTGAGTGTFTDGAAINTASYAGAFPYLRVSGLTGSGVVTVTCDVYDPTTEAIITGRTFTATVTANGLWPMAVGTAPADSLITNVTGIAIAAGISAGTIYVEGWRPLLTSGTSTAGSATTITLDTTALRVDDIYNGLVIGQAADKYDVRTILDYDGATRIATVSAWTSAPSTTAYRIWRPQF